MFTSITVQTGATTAGRFGGTSETWTDSFVVGGEVRQVFARENTEGFDQRALQIILPYTPSTTSINTLNRLVINGQNYNITNVDTFSRNRRQVWISAIAEGGANA